MLLKSILLFTVKNCFNLMGDIVNQENSICFSGIRLPDPRNPFQELHMWSTRCQSSYGEVKQIWHITTTFSCPPCMLNFNLMCWWTFNVVLFCSHGLVELASHSMRLFEACHLNDLKTNVQPINNNSKLILLFLEKFVRL